MPTRGMILYLSFFVLVFCIALSTGMSSLAGERTFHNAASIDLDTIKLLDLRTAKKFTMMENPSLAAAEERLRQARQKVIQARSSYWPRLDATGSASHVYMSDNDYQTSLAAARMTNPFAEVDDEEEYYKTALTLTWTLFNGFERKFSNMSARSSEKEGREARMDAQRLLLSSVAESYHNALLARENITIAEANKAFNLRQLDEAKARHRVGTGSLTDVLNFEVRINSAGAELIKAKQAYKVAMSALAALMGVPDGRLPSHLELVRLEAETPEELVVPDPGPLIEYAMDHRPDIRQRNYLLKQAESNVGSARAGFFPTINLSASLDGDRTDSTGFEREDFGETIAVSLSYNLFAGGYNRAKLREAKARQEEAKRNLESIMIRVKSEVVSAIAELRSAQEQLALQRSNAVLVKQNRDLVEKEYAAGLGSLVRLNEAQRDLITAQSRLASALVSLRQGWQNLEAITSEILVPFED
jgi:outer membrane protein